MQHGQAYRRCKEHAGLLIVVLTGLVLTKAETTNQPSPLAAGTESVVVVPQTGARMKVFLPANYQATNKWPAIFFFPGQHGTPSTTFIRRHLDDRDCIVAALPYVTPDSDKPLPDFASRELQNFRTARQWLTTHVSVDETRVLLGGISKGGWTTSLLGEPELSRLAGLIIVLAGRSFPFTSAPGGAAYRGKPIYIGDGETDNNMRPARQATTFFFLHGAATTFEEYVGLGHATSPDAPRLRAWLRVQTRYHQRDGPTLAELGQWFTNTFATAKAAPNNPEQFRLALDLVRDPRLSLCGAPSEKAARNWFKEVTSHSPAKEEWTAETTYWDLLWKVTSLRLLDDLRATRDGFQKLSATYPTSRWGQLAAEDYRILADAYDRSAGAMTTNQTTTTGVNNRGIPVPRRVGNKIIFDR